MSRLVGPRPSLAVPFGLLGAASLTAGVVAIAAAKEAHGALGLSDGGAYVVMVAVGAWLLVAGLVLWVAALAEAGE